MSEQSAFERLIRGTLKLHQLDAIGQLDSPEADAVRDAMDVPWYKASESEREAGRLVSAALHKRAWTSKANAQLISAAPELLDACRLLVALEDADAHDFDTRWKTARKMMRDAIAKATERKEDD
jgi:hypothetical protein